MGTSQPNDIGKVSWIRLPSVTHSFDESQRINFLQFQADAGRLTVTAPNSPNVCPPGHYMLFILSKDGVPSIARIMQIQAAVAPAAVACRGTRDGIVDTGPGGSEPGAYVDVYARRGRGGRGGQRNGGCDWHHWDMSLRYCCLLGRRLRGAEPPGRRGPGKPHSKRGRFNRRSFSGGRTFARVGSVGRAVPQHRQREVCTARRRGHFAGRHRRAGWTTRSWRAVDRGHRSS